MNNVEWIPVKERLPEEDGLYLVTFAGDLPDLDVLMYYRSEGNYPFWDYRGENFSYAYECDEIAAWAYLPEPYKEVKDGSI